MGRDVARETGARDRSHHRKGKWRVLLLSSGVMVQFVNSNRKQPKRENYIRSTINTVVPVEELGYLGRGTLQVTE